MDQPGAKVEENRTFEGAGQPFRAHGLSHSTFQDAPLVEWGWLLENKDSLPALFWTALPDDSMAPRAGVGKMVCFDKSLHSVGRATSIRPARWPSACSRVSVIL